MGIEIEEIRASKNSNTDVYLRDIDNSLINEKLKNLPTKEMLRFESKEFEENASRQSFEEYIPVIADIINSRPEGEEDIERSLPKLRKKYKLSMPKHSLLLAYRYLLKTKRVERYSPIESYLISKSIRSSSGVLVVTVFTSPYPTINGKVQHFSCQWDCHYCPNEPGQPRSYLLNEPGVRRANMNDFDAVRQFRDRVSTLVDIGHQADKVEVLVLGGTWESYPLAYQETFVRDIYYAANSFFTGERDRLTLTDEKYINTSSQVRVIGLTLETRPDTIDVGMLHRLRAYGCTRIQLGVQHIDDSVLKTINRKCFLRDILRALRLLKEACFKIDIHIMPDLPGSTPELDKAMFQLIIENENLQVDQWKIYPCQTTPWTVIEKWYQDGSYTPYGFENLVDVLVDAKSAVHPWIRLNRVIRDIPPEYVLGGTCCTNLRQLIERKLLSRGKKCSCIRHREVKDTLSSVKQLPQAELVRRDYVGQGALEVFLSFESPARDIIFGFLRLRLSCHEDGAPFAELENSAMIRELHVYGRIVRSEQKNSGKVQHAGIGKKLLREAERISVEMGFRKIAVISGVGVRSYYKDRGYSTLSHDGEFQIKDLSYAQRPHISERICLYSLIIAVLLLLKGLAKSMLL